MRPAPTATLTHCVLLGVAARLTIISGTAPPLRSERRCPDGSINSFGPCPAPLVPEPAFHVVGPPEVPPPPLARTRITVAPSERGATSLHVKAAGAFHEGDRVRINPGGATEEDNVVARAPFVLATPLRHMHGLGETVLLLNPAAAAATAAEAAAPVAAPARARAVVGRRRAGLFGHAGGGGGGGESDAPPAAAQEREPPLHGVARIVARSTRGGHYGVEAAAALLVVLLCALLMGGYVLKQLCEYSLCCFGRGKPGGSARGCCVPV